MEFYYIHICENINIKGIASMKNSTLIQLDVGKNTPFQQKKQSQKLCLDKTVIQNEDKWIT
jgi:hypothetical protein